ncbi:MAG: hypothetical protein R3D87_11960 [Paracoccaceae bacterium]
MALDGSGNIIGTTRGVLRALLPGEGELVGRHIEEVLDLSIDDLPT